jgi:hypothetical protein
LLEAGMRARLLMGLRWRRLAGPEIAV